MNGYSYMVHIQLLEMKGNLGPELPGHQNQRVIGSSLHLCDESQLLQAGWLLLEGRVKGDFSWFSSVSMWDTVEISSTVSPH